MIYLRSSRESLPLPNQQVVIYINGSYYFAVYKMPEKVFEQRDKIELDPLKVEIIWAPMD